jgi:hypothetical protein
MPDFHRLENPPADYVSGGGTLPAGYDYINNDPASASGTAAGERAQVNAGPKPSGFNSGTYFLGWRDAGLSANVNRLAQALAQNTDYLDNLLRKRQAVPKTVQVTTVGGETYIQISDWVWCGDSGSDDPTLLVQVLENDGTYAEASYEVAGNRFPSEASDIKDSTGAVSVLGSGWIQNPRIYLDLDSTPQNLVLVYGSRSSMAAHHAGAIHELHQFSSVSFELQQVLWGIKGEKTSAWTGSPPSNLLKLKTKGLGEAYDAWDDNFSSSTPGGGYLITRGGKAPTSKSQIARTYPDPVNALWKAEMRDTSFAGSNSRSNWAPGSVGFASYGVRWDIKGKKDYAPSYASFVAFDSPRQRFESLLHDEHPGEHRGDVDSRR